MSKLDSGIEYVNELFFESGDSGWIEGWICGYTDPENGPDGDEIKTALLDYLAELRGTKQEKTIKED